MEKVIVFGRGNFYKEREALINEKYCIYAFVDNAVPESEDDRYDKNGIPVLNPQNLLRLPEFPIILMGKQFIAMYEQLKKMKINLERVVYGIMFPPYAGIEKALFSNGGNILSENGDLLYCSCDGEKIKFSSWDELICIAQKILREEYYKKDSMIKHIASMSTYPVCRDFGMSRGKAVDRVYIERFLEENKKYIKGETLEIAENTYTLRYGENRIKNSYILHLEGWGDNAIKGNLETGEGITANKYDCAIITQTLMFIFDFKKVAENIYRLLKKGGTALITVSGIGQISRYDADNWGSFFGFHEDAMKNLFVPIFGEKNTIINSYGNVKTAVALLYGLCYEELKESDFLVNDKDYPVIITVLLHKE